MVMKKLFLVAIPLLLAVGIMAVAQGNPSIPAVTQTQFLAPRADWRNLRYCEVIPVFRVWFTLPVEVYNTIGLNDCPSDVWAKLEAEQLAKQFNAQVVKLNGPRYWVLNKLIGSGATADGKIVDFGGIQMKLVAKLETNIWQGSVGDLFYTENQVKRNTVFTYNAGNMVYELISPRQEIYRMQSYSQIKDNKLSIDDLEQLGQRLNLPSGWTYQVRVLKNISELKADSLAFVINDDFYNSYQKVLP